MKLFLVKLVLFSLIQAGILVLLLRCREAPVSSNYLAATVEKHARLNSVPAPRLILIGGSNVSFGIRSDLLEASLGRPTVNMGLAAGLGLEFMLAEVEPSLAVGDWVLLSPEYDLLRGGFDPDIVEQVITFEPGPMVRLGSQHWRKILLDRGLMLVGAISRQGWQSLLQSNDPATGGERQAFNTQGDFTGHYGRAATVRPDLLLQGTINTTEGPWPSVDVERLLAGFVGRCQARGIRVFLSHPPRPKPSYELDRVLLEGIDVRLRSISGLELLDNPAGQVFEPSLFYDTGYHLDKEGATLRTRRIIKSLEQIMNQAAPGAIIGTPRPSGVTSPSEKAR